MIHPWSNLQTLEILPNGTSKCVHALVSGRGRLVALNWLLFLRIHPFKHHLKWIQLVLMNNKQREDHGFPKNHSPGMMGFE